MWLQVCLYAQVRTQADRQTSEPYIASRKIGDLFIMGDSLYPTLEAHREKLQGPDYAHWPAEALRIRLSALANAYTYPLDTNTLRDTEINPSLRMERENHLWIELSEPVCNELITRAQWDQTQRLNPGMWIWSSDRADITAMFYYWRALECTRLGIPYQASGRYDLEMIANNGYSYFTFSYYATVKKWAIPCVLRCEKCTHQEHSLSYDEMQEPCVTPCQRCDSWLRAWRKHFRRALTIIQRKR
jgi:hypothetical protein